MPIPAVTTNNEISMAKNRFSRLVSLVIILMIAGCAHKPVEPTASGSQADAGNAAAAAIDPGNPDDITALGKRLIQDRLTLFSVIQGKYTFYVGGVLSATYEPATQILRISALTAADKVEQVCEYSPQGVLFVDPKDQAKKDAFVNNCNHLVMLLNDYLSR